MHLNRALCKLKLEKPDDALWDCEQAIELEPSTVKGHFRRALAYLEKLKGELKKEEQKEFWQIETAQKYVEEATSSLNTAEELSATDQQAKIAQRPRSELRHYTALLQRYEHTYKRQQKDLYRNKIIGGLERAHARNAPPPTPIDAVDDAFADMPPLSDD